MTELPMVTSDELAAYREGDDELLLRAATREVRNYCGWHVAPVLTHTVELDGGAVLLLPTMRLIELVAVESVAVPPVPAELSAFTASSSGVIVASPTATVDQRWWQRRTGRLRVTFKHGWDSAPDVESVVLAVADRMSDNPRGVAREQAGPFSTQYGSLDLSDFASKLGPYTLPSLP